jgi:hypothetical protein
MQTTRNFGEYMRLIAFLLIAFGLSRAGSENKTLRGWLSDEACARGRAKAGLYTGTNPECAKRCVAQGKRIVFIDPEARLVLDISNQGAALSNIGDEVAITGEVDVGKNVVHIDSMKLISRGVAMCTRPKTSNR